MQANLPDSINLHLVWHKSRLMRLRSISRYPIEIEFWKVYHADAIDSFILLFNYLDVTP